MEGSMGSMARSNNTNAAPPTMVDYKGRISFTTNPEQMTSTSPVNVERYGFSKGVPPEWNHWVFETRHLQEMPSVRLSAKMSLRHRPMSPREDALVRAKAFNFLTDICLQLNMSRLVWATACSIVHRFYMKRSHQRHIYYDICAAALYIACKDADFGPDLTPHLVKHVAARAFKARGNTSVPASEREKWWKTIRCTELLVRKTLEFDVTMEHPHHHLARAALATPGKFPRAVWLAAYRFVDAAHTSMVSILHPPRIIAAAALAWALNYACHPSSFPEMHGMTGTGVRKDDVTPPYDPILTGLAKSPRPTVHESYLSWPKTLGVPSRIYGGMTSIDDEIFGQEEGEGDKEQEVLKMWKDPQEISSSPAPGPASSSSSITSASSSPTSSSISGSTVMPSIPATTASSPSYSTFHDPTPPPPGHFA
ncbi:MAG: cyclin-like protein [Piptocephalis tieghemiana]|nr:MAG: cyclin-like protein [Piptocephalis tieghemiana]